MKAAITRESISSQIRKLLIDKIVNGELKPGERLTELRIAAELKTSQAPVREAFRELETMGLIVSEPYKGSRVREVSKEDVREAYSVRAVLEALAGELAAPVMKGATHNLKHLAAEIEDAARRKSISDYVRSDIAFHRAIVEAAGNKLLLRSWDALGFEVRMHFRLAKWSLDMVKAQREHKPIIEALDAGDGESAAKLLRAHVQGFIVAG